MALLEALIEAVLYVIVYGSMVIVVPAVLYALAKWIGGPNGRDS